MPGKDRTGPAGAGPMTGRGRGVCAPSGFGRGRGFGWRSGAAPATPPAELSELRNQIDRLQQQIDTLESKS